MFQSLIKDYKRSGRKDALIYLFFYRLGNKIYYSNIPKYIKIFFVVLIKIPYKILNFMYNCEIPFSAQIGNGVKIPHLNGIVIHWKAIIGENCTIYHQVTIGANEHKEDWKKAPHIGDEVYIGAGSKILGNIYIGSNVTIGANAVITKNINNNCVVVGSNKIVKETNRKDYTCK